MIPRTSTFGPRPSTRGRGRPRGRPRKRALRGAAAALLSVAIHAAVLAWAVLPIPGTEKTSGLRVFVTPPALEERAPERALEVIRIRPPGLLAAGGGASEAGIPAVAAPVLTTPPPSRATTGPSLEPSVALLAPAVETPSAPPLAAPGGEGEAEAPTSRPNRGVVLKTGGSDADRGRGVRGVGAASGLGGGTGVTVVGRGGDCITPGLAVPEAPRGGWLPNGRGRPGGLPAVRGRIGG